jgi:hypothetical protein
MAKIAKIVTRNVRPCYSHDCSCCRFLGRLDGQDLYFCPVEGSYLARYGSQGHQMGTLGNLTPEGTPYSLARTLSLRADTLKVQHGYRTVTDPRMS